MLSFFFIFPGLVPFNDDSSLSLFSTPYSFCLNPQSHPLTPFLYPPHFCSLLFPPPLYLLLPFSHLSFLVLCQTKRMFWWLSNNSCLCWLAKVWYASVSMCVCVIINSTNQILICSRTHTSSPFRSNRLQLHDFSVTTAEFIHTLPLTETHSCVCVHVCGPHEFSDIFQKCSPSATRDSGIISLL